MADAPARQRLFFALWPDPAVRARLAALRKWLPDGTGRPVAADNLHLTLAFVGPVEEAIGRCLERRAARIACHRFRLEIDSIGVFPRARVAWAAPATTPVGLSRLVRSLNAVVAGCGLQPEKRLYQPHVTLARKSRFQGRALRIDAVEWIVAAFCLMVSETHPTGVRYRVLKRYECG